MHDCLFVTLMTDADTDADADTDTDADADSDADDAVITTLILDYSTFLSS